MNALSSRQRRAARYLGLGMTQVAVAKRIVVNPRTIRRWREDIPEFTALVDEERTAGRDLQAEDVLHDLMLSTDGRVRLAAARELRRTQASTPVEGDDDLGQGWD